LAFKESVIVNNYTPISESPNKAHEVEISDILE